MPSATLSLDQFAGFKGEILRDEPLSKHTYYKIGGPADWVLLPNCREDLDWVGASIPGGIPIFVMGAGSNLLVSDAGFRGVVIKTKKLNTELHEIPAGIVRVGSGVLNSTLLRRAADAGWGGLEFLTGVPGSAGGAVFMNAGTHLGESAQAIAGVEVWERSPEGSARWRNFSGNDLKYQYRKNLFLNDSIVGAGVSIVWNVDFNIRHEPASEVKRRIDETLARRKGSQPIEYPSCGSVFKNPKGGADQVGLHAWQVIEKIGLRGARVGGAQFSEKHCNFIVNHGGAKASDVLALISQAKTQALEQLGLTLEEEVRMLGF